MVLPLHHPPGGQGRRRNLKPGAWPAGERIVPLLTRTKVQPTRSGAMHKKEGATKNELRLQALSQNGDKEANSQTCTHVAKGGDPPISNAHFLRPPKCLALSCSGKKKPLVAGKFEVLCMSCLGHSRSCFAAQMGLECLQSRGNKGSAVQACLHCLVQA